MHFSFDFISYLKKKKIGLFVFCLFCGIFAFIGKWNSDNGKERKVGRDLNPGTFTWLCDMWRPSPQLSLCTFMSLTSLVACLANLVYYTSFISFRITLSISFSFSALIHWKERCKQSMLMSGGLFQKGKLQGGWMCVWAVSRQSKWNLKN